MAFGFAFAGRHQSSCHETRRNLAEESCYGLPSEKRAMLWVPHFVSQGIMMNACTSTVARMRKWQHSMLMLEASVKVFEICISQPLTVGWRLQQHMFELAQEVSDDYENIAFNAALSSMGTFGWKAQSSQKAPEIVIVQHHRGPACGLLGKISCRECIPADTTIRIYKQ